MRQVWALINLVAVPEKVFTTGDDRQVQCVKSYDIQGITVFISTAERCSSCTYGL